MRTAATVFLLLSLVGTPSAARAQGNEWEALNREMVSLYKKGQYDRAIADYDKAIKLNPRDANAYNNRGFAYGKKGQRDKAISDYRKALQIDPSHQFAKRNLKALGIVTGLPASIMAAAEFVVPRSIPITFPILYPLLSTCLL